MKFNGLIYFNWRITITIFSVFLIGVSMTGCKNSQEVGPSTAVAFVALNDMNLSSEREMEACLKKYMNTLNLSMTDFSLREEVYFLKLINFNAQSDLLNILSHGRN